jgi:hypothetical protein
VQTIVDSSNSLVACSCESAYTGSFCEKQIDFCAVADLCNLYPSLGLDFTCTSLTTSLKYKCNGVCPPTGFTQDSHSACIGKLTLFSFKLIKFSYNYESTINFNILSI